MMHERQQLASHRLNLPTQKSLFGNNYHMMAENYTEEGTKRSIRKHILMKFGRLLPVNHSYQMGTQHYSRQLSPRETEAQQASFNEVKLTLPALCINRNSFEQVKLKTNIVVSKDDMPIAHNHSVYERVRQQVEMTEQWEQQLKTVLGGLEKAERIQLMKLPKKQRDNSLPDVAPSRSPKYTLAQLQQIFLTPQGNQEQSTERKRIQSDYYKKEGKHLILLKNLYV